MAEDLTDDEIINLSLELAKKGGERGRAIFYKFCFDMQDDHPEFVFNMMETVLPAMPEGDQKIILYCLNEYNRGRTLDLEKMANDEMRVRSSTISPIETTLLGETN